jgi:hypothetical protein
MNQEIKLINSFPQSIAERKIFIQKVVDEILDGFLNPLDCELALKNLEDTISLIRKNEQVKEALMSEANKYGKKFDFKNAEITISSKTTFDYSGDSTWTMLKEQLKDREEKLKIARDHKIIDEETGEIIMPPSQKMTEFLIIKFK